MTSTNKIINKYLNGKKVDKENFDDFKIVIETVGDSTKILDWFSYLHKIETVGWRPKLVTQKVAKLLSRNEPIQFYALFCPSYKKGRDIHGFRTDGVGDTSKWGMSTLKAINDKTTSLGFKCLTPLAVFFDVAVEQPEKSIPEISDLKKNIENLKQIVPNNVEFRLLSKQFPFLMDIIGYKGIKIDPLPVPKVTLARIIERGRKFYELFAWTEKQIEDRSRTIASSEALVGSVLRDAFPTGLMVYTPTMLERAQVYSGHRFETDPLPIIFPKHEDITGL